MAGALAGSRPRPGESRPGAERDGGCTIHLTWEPEFQRLSGFVSAPCAMDPGWPEEKEEQEKEDGYSGSYDEPDLNSPPVLTPA
ncbi:hypothetical protein ACFZA4_00095 [Streptomyces antimycoticus]|uniref:hypothetical protein n=1 Tax=Streptomyces antimycoticus TaxID=68175 RepID=UPI0033CF16FB